VKLCFGESLFAVGSPPSLGSWNCAGAVPLTWAAGDVWSGSVLLPIEGQLELKFVVRRGDGSLVWQEGANLVLQTAKDERLLSFVGIYPPGSGSSGQLHIVRA
jgi:hypothetical protein